MSSAFDAETFLNATTTEAATRRPPLNASLEYIGTLGTPVPRIGIQGKKDPTKTYNFIDFPISIDLTALPKERERVGQDSVTLSHSVSLDVNETGIDWSPGRNTGLRLLREALNMNVPGQPFSLLSVEGRQVRVSIKHEDYLGDIQDRVKGVARP